MEEWTGDAWAQLVSTADILSDPVSIDTDKFTIGRSKGADLCLAGNKLVSGKHCHIERDSNGTAWICDTSTNGTLLNLTKKLEHVKEQLEHGDEVHVVYRKTEPDLNVSYLFQDLAKLKAEEEEEENATHEYSTSDLDATLENEELHEMELETVREKRKSEELEVDVNNVEPVKRQKTEEPSAKLDSSEEKPAGSIEQENSDKIEGSTAEKSDETDGPEESEAASKIEKEPKDKKGGKLKSKKTKKDIPKPKSDEEENTGAESGNMHPKAGSETEAPSCGGGDGEKKEKEKSSQAQKQQDATLEDTLTCIICQEIMHNCVSLQPCLHSFCAGCYSDWMQRSAECPSCRMAVERVKRSHMLNNLVEMFLSQHPERRRPEDELKALDEKNKIKKDLVRPSSPTIDLSQEIDDHDGYEGYESPLEELEPDDDGDNDNDDNEGYSDSDEDDGGIKPPTYGAPPTKAGPFGTAVHSGTYILPKTICRQCPHNIAGGTGATVLGQAAAAVGGVAAKLVGFVTGKDVTTTDGKTDSSTTSNATAATSASTKPTMATPSTSEAARPDDAGKVMPTPPQHICRPNQVHMLCQCCLEAMPDRRTDRVKDPMISPQQCSLCYRMFCHAYWGCRKVNCRGCLGKLNDINFDDNCLNTLILDNYYESTIFKNYLKSKSISLADLLKECCQKLDEGQYKLAAVPATSQSSGRIVCYPCGLRCFGDLAYQYRREIPNDSLPVEVTLRQNCYWGKQCRSQKSRPHHAANFNHICDQTRRT